jgi:post-segregation antitoxin (ccd killing protein)
MVSLKKEKKERSSHLYQKTLWYNITVDIDDQNRARSRLKSHLYQKTLWYNITVDIDDQNRARSRIINVYSNIVS